VATGTSVSKTQVGKARVIVGAPPERPVIFPVGLVDTIALSRVNGGIGAATENLLCHPKTGGASTDGPGVLGNGIASRTFSLLHGKMQGKNRIRLRNRRARLPRNRFKTIG